LKEPINRVQQNLGLQVCLFCIVVPNEQTTQNLQAEHVEAWGHRQQWTTSASKCCWGKPRMFYETTTL